jgi:hypothetical protein
MCELAGRLQRSVRAAGIVLSIFPFTLPIASGQPIAAPDLAEIQPLIPPGISDFNLEVFGKLSYTWSDGTANVIEVLGNFTARLGPYKLSSRDAVIWIDRKTWQDKPYISADVFLWQDAELLQPAGTVERGPALMVSLRISSVRRPRPDACWTPSRRPLSRNRIHPFGSARQRSG